MNRFFIVLIFLLVFSGGLSAQNVSFEETVDTGAGGVPNWKPERCCRIIRKNNAMHIEAVGGEPQLYLPFDLTCENFRVRIRVRTKIESTLEFRWITRQSPRRGTDKSHTIPLTADGGWHDYDVSLPINGTLTGLSIRLTASEGVWEIGSFEMQRKLSPPLAVTKVVPEPVNAEKPVSRNMIYTLTNTSPGPVTFAIRGSSKKGTLSPGKSMRLLVPFTRIGALGESVLRVVPDGFGPLAFPVFHYLPDAHVEWLSLPLSETSPQQQTPLEPQPLQEQQTPHEPQTTHEPQVRQVAQTTETQAENEALLFEVSRDARVARVRRGNALLALIAPLVHRDGEVPAFQALDSGPAPDASDTPGAPATLRFTAPDASLTLEVNGDTVRFRVQPPTAAPTAATDTVSPAPTEDAPVSAAPFEGPVVRVLGTLCGGLLPGVEFLGPGDTSSSPIDIAEPDNRRNTPPPKWITIPLAVLATDRVCAALAWSETDLNPCFAAPNTIDSTPDHRMNLSGNVLDVSVRFLPTAGALGSDPIPEMIRWGVARFGIPEPGTPPRDTAAGQSLCLKALQGPLLGEDRMSWAYALDGKFPRRPFAEPISVQWRLSGKLPSFSAPHLETGGSDIADDAAFFLFGKVEAWKNANAARAAAIAQAMRADGSFATLSRFPDYDTTDTSPGYGAVRVLQLLEWVRYSGDLRLFAAVEKALAYLDRYEVPRGGFYMETPLHTPDLLSAAYLTWAYIWAYELSGNPAYLAQARRWALRGLAFVYLWDDAPTMRFATVAKLGGVNRKPPLEFATARPCAGLIFAYSLLLLDPYDRTLDWKRVATGIVNAVERMQYDSGPEAGCVPELFRLETQQRDGMKISPCALMTLRLALEGKPHDLFVAADTRDRLVAPYPVTLDADGAIVHGIPAGTDIQVLQNGKTVHDLTGTGNGTDRIELR